MSCAATDLPRWAELGLADPLPDERMPEQGSTADLLAWALCAPGADEPIAGIVNGVRLDLAALVDVAPSLPIATTLVMLGRRLAVASLLLRRADERAPTPPEYDPDAPTATAAPDEGDES
jgi:hypothetical protein